MKLSDVINICVFMQLYSDIKNEKPFIEMTNYYSLKEIYSCKYNGIEFTIIKNVIEMMMVDCLSIFMIGILYVIFYFHIMI